MWQPDSLLDGNISVRVNAEIASKGMISKIANVDETNDRISFASLNLYPTPKP